MWLSNWILKFCSTFFCFSPNQIGKKKYQELYYIIEIWEIPQTVKTDLVGQIWQLCHLTLCVCEGGNAWIRESGQHMKIMQCILWERPDLLPLGLRRWAWNDLIIFNTTFWRFQILGGTSSHFSTWLLSIHVATCALSFFDEFFWIIIEVQKQGKGSLLCVTAVAL